MLERYVSQVRLLVDVLNLELLKQANPKKHLAQRDALKRLFR